MIKIEAEFIDGAVMGIHAEGHAGSGPYGHDLVCAAVSAILVGGFNALEGDQYRFETKSGLGSVVCLAKPNPRDQIVLETIVTQLASVAESYPDNVKLERK